MTADPLSRLTARLHRLTCAACVGLFIAIFLIMLMQIAFRYLLGTPLVWTEELARYLFVWVCYLGAPVALRRGTHIRVSVVAACLPPRVGRGLFAVLQAVALLFLAQLAVQGGRLAARVHTVWAVTVPIPWSAIYLAVPVAAALMILETVEAWRHPLPPDSGQAGREVLG